MSIKVELGITTNNTRTRTSFKFRIYCIVFVSLYTVRNTKNGSFRLATGTMTAKEPCWMARQPGQCWPS